MVAWTELHVAALLIMLLESRMRVVPLPSAGMSRHCPGAGLLVSRAFVGLGEGIAPSAATDMVARIGNENERSRSISFIYSGLHVGSLLGLLVAPQLIDHFGWQTVGSSAASYVLFLLACETCT